MNRLSYRSAATLGIVCLGVRAFFAAYIDSPDCWARWLGVCWRRVSLPALAALYAIARLYPGTEPGRGSHRLLRPSGR